MPGLTTVKCSTGTETLHPVLDDLRHRLNHFVMIVIHIVGCKDLTELLSRPVFMTLFDVANLRFDHFEHSRRGSASDRRLVFVVHPIAVESKRGVQIAARILLSILAWDFLGWKFNTPTPGQE